MYAQRINGKLKYILILFQTKLVYHLFYLQIDTFKIWIAN